MLSASNIRCLRHVVAVLISTSFLAAIPVVLYGVLIVWAKDLGGPLNLIIIPFVSGFVGLLTSLVIFLPASLIAEKSNLKLWLQLIGGFSAISVVAAGSAWTVIAMGRVRAHGVWIASTGLSVVVWILCGFFVYLCCLALGRKILPDR